MTIILVEQVQLYFQEASLSPNLKSFDTGTKQYKKVNWILENLPKSWQTSKVFVAVQSAVIDPLDFGKVTDFGLCSHSVSFIYNNITN